MVKRDAQDPPLQQAIQAFLNADTPEEMAQAVDTYPVMGEPAFEEAVERLADHAIRAGDPQAVLRIQTRLEMLALVTDDAGSELEAALDDFLAAPDAGSARAVFQAAQEILATPEAGDLLAALEPLDDEDAVLLAQRRDLWRALYEETLG